MGSCSNTNQEQVAQLSMQLDSTRLLLDSLIKMQTQETNPSLTDSSALKRDTLKRAKEEELLFVPPAEKPQKVDVERKKDPPKPAITQSQPEPEVYYYSGGKKTSVQIINGEQRSKDFVLFDPWGKETYRFEQRIESYSVTVDLVEWHPNGALHKAVVHTNPGASMYWYTAEYTFGINNEPLWMVSTQHPETTVSFETDNSYYWDPKSKTWKKQEIVREQPVPRD